MPEALLEYSVLSFDVWVNSILAFIAVVGFITSLVFSIKSNRNLNQQIRLQNHPILKLMESGEEKSRRVLEIKNIGTGPAFSVKLFSDFIEKHKDFMSLEPIDPRGFNYLGIQETHSLESGDHLDLTAAILNLLKESKKKDYAYYSVVYYEDIFGDSYVCESWITLRNENTLVYDTASPRMLSKNEIKVLNPEKYKKRDKQGIFVTIEKLSNHIKNIKSKIAGGRK